MFGLFSTACDKTSALFFLEDKAECGSVWDGCGEKLPSKQEDQIFINRCKSTNLPTITIMENETCVSFYFTSM